MGNIIPKFVKCIHSATKILSKLTKAETEKPRDPLHQDEGEELDARTHGGEIPNAHEGHVVYEDFLSFGVYGHGFGTIGLGFWGIVCST